MAKQIIGPNKRGYTLIPSEKVKLRSKNGKVLEEELAGAGEEEGKGTCTGAD